MYPRLVHLVRPSAVALACAVAVLALAPSASAATRVVRGDVVSSAGDAIAGADVTVMDEKGATLSTGKTDGLGRFAIELADGSATPTSAKVHVQGLADATVKIAKGSGDDARLHVALGPAAAAAIDVEVTAEKPIAAAAPESQPTHYSVDPTLMAKMPGTRGDPFNAITSLPSLGRPPALSTVYIVRGASPVDSGTYVDGAPLPHAFHFGGFVAVVPGALVESIAIIPGGFGVAYGRATAGLIDVQLAIPCVGPAAKPGATCEGVHGSLGLDAIDVSVVGSAVIAGKTKVALGARRSHVDAWIGKVLGDTVTGDLPRYLDGQALIEHEFSHRFKVRLGLIAADDDVNVTDPNQPADKPRSGSWHSSMARAHARMEAKLGERGLLLGVFAVGKASDSIIGETDQWSDARKTLFARLEGSSDVGEGDGARVTFGVDALATHLDGSRVLQIPVSGFGGSNVFPLRGAIVVERFEPGAYAQLVLRPAAPFLVTAGVRVDRHYLGSAVVQPRLSFRAAVGEHTALKASTGIYARPNVFDAVDARDSQGALLPVVVDAGPVRALHLGFGLEQGLGAGVDLLADVYARVAHGLLVPLQGRPVPIYEERLRPGATIDFDTQRVLAGYRYPLYADSGRTRAYGIELLLRARVGSFAGFIGYALSRAELRDGPYADWRRAPLDQTHVLNAAAVVSVGRGWEVGARFRLAVGVLDSPYPATDIAPKNDPDVDPNRQLPQLAPIHSLDLRVEKCWTIGTGGTLAAYVEVRNVYNRRAREPLAYNYVYDYPVAGNGLPIIPNLGVRGAF